MAHHARFIILAGAALFAACPAGSFAQTGTKERRIILSPEAQEMNGAYYGIGELLAGDWGDVRFLDQALLARLEDRGDLPGSNAQIWASQVGYLHGIALRRIELVVSRDDASQRMLILELAEPGPDARGLAERFSRNAEYTPPHPGARDAPGIWKVTQYGYTLSFSHKRDSMQITGISLIREQDRRSPP